MNIKQQFTTVTRLSKIVALILFIALPFIGFYLGMQYKKGIDSIVLNLPQVSNQQKPTACTMEAKVCPDGTSVGRTGSNCEFVACPTNQDGTVNWKTYENKAYNYSIKYPTNWYVDTKNSENTFTKRGDSDIIGGDTYFSNYPNSSSYILPETPKDIFNVSLMVFKVDPNISYDQFIASYGKGTKESVNINGLNALRLTGITIEDPAGVTVVNTFVKMGGNMFVFNYSGNPTSSDKKDISEKIIFTFKLTK